MTVITYLVVFHLFLFTCFTESMENGIENNSKCNVIDACFGECLGNHTENHMNHDFIDTDNESSVFQICDEWLKNGSLPIEFKNWDEFIDKVGNYPDILQSNPQKCSNTTEPTEVKLSLEPFRILDVNPDRDVGS